MPVLLLFYLLSHCFLIFLVYWFVSSSLILHSSLVRLCWCLSAVLSQGHAHKHGFSVVRVSALTHAYPCEHTHRHTRAFIGTHSHTYTHTNTHTKIADAHAHAHTQEYTGHGIGTAFHEGPRLPHYGRPGTGMVLREGMTLTIEPMLNAGGCATTYTEHTESITTHSMCALALFLQTHTNQQTHRTNTQTPNANTLRTQERGQTPTKTSLRMLTCKYTHANVRTNPQAYADKCAQTNTHRRRDKQVSTTTHAHAHARSTTTCAHSTTLHPRQTNTHPNARAHTYTRTQTNSLSLLSLPQTQTHTYAPKH